MRLLFFGDGLWATESLKRLLDDGHQVLSVILRKKPSEDSLERFSQKSGLPVTAPGQVNDSDFVAWVREQPADLNVSVSYDQILRRPILETAPLGFINCHAGKLPYYRGRNVINWAIINNETEIGLTIHYIDEGIDTGDIILQKLLPIHWEDSYQRVLNRVQRAIPGLLSEAVTRIVSGKVRRLKQNHLEGTYFSKRIHGDEWIDWGDTSLNIYNKIRAISHPGPGARALFGSRTLIIWQASYDPAWPKYMAVPSEVAGIMPDGGIKVKTGDSTVILNQVQFEGKENPADIRSFRIGNRFSCRCPEVLRHLKRQLTSEPLSGNIKAKMINDGKSD